MLSASDVQVEVLKVEPIEGHADCKCVTLKVVNPEPYTVYELDYTGDALAESLLVTTLPNWNLLIVDHPRYAGLSMRVKSYLKNAGIEYLGQLCMADESDMNRVPNFGQKSVKEVKTFLAHFGFALGLDPTKWNGQTEPVNEALRSILEYPWRGQRA